MKQQLGITNLFQRWRSKDIIEKLDLKCLMESESYVYKLFVQLENDCISKELIYIYYGEKCLVILCFTNKK